MGTHSRYIHIMTTTQATKQSKATMNTVTRFQFRFDGSEQWFDATGISSEDVAVRAASLAHGGSFIATKTGSYMLPTGAMSVRVTNRKRGLQRKVARMHVRGNPVSA